MNTLRKLLFTFACVLVNTAALAQSPCGEWKPDVPRGFVVVEGDIIVPEDWCHGDAPWTWQLWTDGIVADGYPLRSSHPYGLWWLVFFPPTNARNGTGSVATAC